MKPRAREDADDRPAPEADVNVATLVADLRGRGVRLWAKGSRLAVSIPDEVYSAALGAELERRKAEILSFLSVEDQSARLSTEAWASPSAEAPASFAQLRMWFLDQLEPGSATYNIATAIRLRGTLDLSLLECCLREIVERHDVLRTAFVVEAAEPIQRVMPNDFSMKICDAGSHGDGEDVATATVIEEARRPFDLARGSMLRATLYRRAAGDHLLLMVTHHIAADGWSLAILLRELVFLYQSASTSAANALPRLPARYADFARWQRAEMTGARLESELAHWRRRLEGAELGLDLPFDRTRPAGISSRAGARVLSIPSRVAGAVRQLARQEGATPFMVVLAGLAALINRYTDRRDFLIGTAVSNRERSETENLIGPFSNIVILRFEIAGDSSARELVRLVRREVQDALLHQELPFEKLVEHLRVGDSNARRPNVSVMFSFHEDRTSRAALPGLALEVVALPVTTAKFDLTFEVTDGPEGFTGFVEYNAELFDDETVARIATHFENLLGAMAAAPEERVFALPMLAGAERNAALGRSQFRSEDAHDDLLHQAFEGWAARTPRQTALRFEGESLTYAALNERANQLAHYLKARGVGVEDRVAIGLAPGVDLIIAVLAVLKAGAAYVPIDPSWPAQRLAYVLGEARASMLISESAKVTGLPRPPCAVVLVDHERGAIEHEDACDVSSHATADNLAYIIFTSGSTGQPKGVAVTHRSVARLFGAARPLLGFGPADVWTLFHSAAFDFSVWEIWGALAHGGALVVVPFTVIRSPAAFLDLLQRERVTMLSQTPAAFRQLAEVDALRTAPLDLRWVVFGGERLDLRDVAPWLERRGDISPRFANMYGITETTVHVTFRPLTRADTRKGSRIGRALPHLHLYLLDRAMQPVPVGVAGEIYVGGAGLARGYFGRPALTADRFVPDPWGDRPGARLYRSGDRARRLPDGDLEYLGRADLQVKVRGYRIELGEIEAAICGHPAIAGAAVVCCQDTMSARLAAFVIRKPLAAAREIELCDFLKAHLPPYMVPASWAFVEQFPLTRNGKLDREALRRMAQVPALAASTEGSAQPSTPAQISLARIWKELLHLSYVGIDDAFFDCGGHSILATQLVARIRDALGVEIPLSVVFGEATTIRELAALIELRRIEQSNADAFLEELQELENLSDEEVKALLQTGDSGQ